MTVQDHVTSSVNDAGTCEKIDTPVTRLRSPPVRRKKHEKFPTGKIYFVRSGKLIKIGFTTDLEGRVSRLQTGSPYDLQLLGTIEGTQREEQALHRRFTNLNVRGEWFRGHASLLEYIRKATHAPEPEAAPEPPAPAEPDHPVKPLSPEARFAISGLLKRRKRVGANTPEGSICTNIIGLIRAQHRNEPKPWATHHTQTFEWSMNHQLKALEKYNAA
jgi:hypothetical protein